MSTLTGRELNEAIRVAVVANLDAEAPCPRTTPEIQACFSSRNRQRVYNALRKAEAAGHIVCIRELMGCWWTSALATPTCHYPDCEKPATRVVYTFGGSTSTGWRHNGGYACSEGHWEYVAALPWPWAADLTTVTPRSAWSSEIDLLEPVDR